MINSANIPALNGLVLAGGQSSRMGEDKGLLSYHGIPQRNHLYRLLTPLCGKVYTSCNKAQASGIAANLSPLTDCFPGTGPLSGLLTAMQFDPGSAWLAVACDLPYLTVQTLAYLIRHRNTSAFATAFINEEDGLPEPMLAIWEPKAYPILLQDFIKENVSMRKALMSQDTLLLHAPDLVELRNVNDPDGFREAILRLGSS